MQTMTITLPTNKAGQLSVFNIKFNVANFDAVIDAVSELKSTDELYNSNLWEVI